MAIDRFILQSDRILISKQGRPASLTMFDEDKIFDSNWDYTGTLLARGIILDTAPGSGETTSTTPLAVAIPIPFTPRDVLVLLNQANDITSVPVYANGGWSNVQQASVNLNFFPAFYFSYSNGTLFINRLQYPGSNPPTYIKRDIRYRIYSV